MYNRAIQILFLLGLIALSASTEAKFFGNQTILIEEFLSCAQHSESPKCHKIIPHGCKTICFGKLDETSELFKACQRLCSKVMDSHPAEDKDH